MLSFQQVPATRSTCRFTVNVYLLFQLKCESATAQDIIREMEILLYKRANNVTVLYLMMSGNNITDLDGQTFQYKELTGISFLRLDQNQISKLPENLFNSQALTSLQILNLSRNKISYLSSKQFSYLENLKELNLSYNKLYHFGLNESVFTSIPSTTLNWIDLSHNKITVLPDGLFEGKALTSLVKLFLQNNNMSEIPKSVFTSNFLTNLTKVKLEHNFINQIPPSSPLLKSTLINLVELNLEFNQLETVSADIFNSANWTSLEILKLDNNNISNIPDSMFSSYLGKLEIISVTNNFIEALPSNLFPRLGLIHLKYLNFSHNMIKTIHVNLFYPEKKVFFVPPHCSKYSLCKSLQKLTHVDLSFNKISRIPNGFFRHLENLKVIKLNNNIINKINVKCFPGSLIHLQILDLSHNLINSPMLEIFTLVLSSMETFPLLNVSYNQLTVQDSFITGRSRYHFEMLHLDLSYNNISTFNAYHKGIRRFKITRKRKTTFQLNVAIQKLLDKILVTIEGNQIFSVKSLVKYVLGLDLNDLSWPMSVTKFATGSVIKLHSYIKTFPYSYHCNCDMEKYLRLQGTPYFKKSIKLYKNLLRSHKTSILGKYGHVESINDFNNLLCGEPAEFGGKYLFELKPTQLQCHDSSCTDSVKCTCTYTPANDTVKVNCTGKRLKYTPRITKNSSNLEVYLGFNDLNQFPVLNLHVSCKIKILDLSYNFISRIPSEFFTVYPEVRKLNLAGNFLMNLPLIPEWNHLNTLSYLELRDNHFICNCSGLSLKKTLMSLNKRIVISDVDRITCYLPEKVKNKVIYDSPDSLFGCPFLNLILILTLFFTLLLFIVILLFIAYGIRDYIKLFLFIHFGWRFFYSYQKEETLYDVFISYSSLDSDWVEERLMKPLEGLDPPYNLCLHERDFQVGIPICDNITRVIEGSKCTLVVVSRNWLESDWCQFEFRVAHCLATVEKKSRLIVLLQEKIPSDEIKGDLELYIKTFTYLDSNNKLFWPRLLTDLPKPNINEARNENDAHENDDIELHDVL